MMIRYGFERDFQDRADCSFLHSWKAPSHRLRDAVVFLDRLEDAQ